MGSQVGGAGAAAGATALPDKSEDPVVEQSPQGDKEDTGARALALRLRQQEILAELGVVSLHRTPFRELLDRTVEFAAEGLQAELCKILEYIPEDNRMLMRAGIGWNPGLIDVASVGADLESPSGYALRTGQPVISNHLENEERFRTPDLLKVHGVRRAINVILQGDGAPFGVLEVDSRSEGEFGENDIAFLQGAANILGMAIERQRYERSLREALQHQKVLVNEINHRVKNSLQLVASMFNLQATASGDPALTQSLNEAIGRVTAVARVHERLYRSPNVHSVDLSAYLADVCADLDALAPQATVQFTSTDPIVMSTDRCVRVALLLTELVTNAAKHARPGTACAVSVALKRQGDDAISLSVRDDGDGLPNGFDIKKSKGLGMKLVTALVSQTGGTIRAAHNQSGAEFIAVIPLEQNAPRG
jgi:two-component sensor histidine kinase